MNHTTQRFSRRINDAFPGGTAYAASIEHHRRTDTSGKTIAMVCLVFIAITLIGFWLK